MYTLSLVETVRSVKCDIAALPHDADVWDNKSINYVLGKLTKVIVTRRTLLNCGYITKVVDVGWRIKDVNFLQLTEQ